MEIYLMQHGQALSEQEDPERPLSRDGIEQIQLSARAIQKMGLVFDIIICSPRRRSHQTAALVAEAIRYPYSDILESDTVLPQEDPEKIVNKLVKMIGDKVLLVGHLPNLSRVVAHLLEVTGTIVRFENGGLACVEMGANEKILKFSLSAAQMRLLGKS